MESQLLRTLGEHTLDLIYAKDVQARFTYVNAALLTMAGVADVDSILGKTDFDFNTEERAQNYYRDDMAVIQTGEPLVDREELVVDSATGKARWHSTTKVPLRDDDGQVIGLLGITRDITARKNAEIDILNLNAELERRVKERTAELTAIRLMLEQERHLMRTLVDAVPDNIYAKDVNSKFLLANRAVARGMGTNAQDLLGKDDFDFYPTELAQVYFNDEQAVIRSGEPMIEREEPSVDNVSGTIRWLLTSKFPVRNNLDEIVGLVGIGRDISLRREAELALRESEARFRSLIELSSDWYWQQDEQFNFVEVKYPNGQSGYLREQLLGKQLCDLSSVSLSAESRRRYADLTRQQESFRDIEIRYTDEKGEMYYFNLTGIPVFDEHGKFGGYRGMGHDISERKRAEKRIQYLATHDSLTQLPNRLFFSETLGLAIQTAFRHKRKLALMFIDLDRFKEVNDTFGHDAGDLLLQTLVKRFQSCLRASDVVGRLGGDEFVILLPEIESGKDLPAIAQKLLSAMLDPIKVAEHSCQITASVGISLYPDHGLDEHILMKNADLAMYHAKSLGKNNFQFYSPELRH